MPRPATLLAPVLLAALAAPAAAQPGAVNSVVPLWQTTTELLIAAPEAPLPVDGGPAALPVEVRYTHTPVPGTFASTPVELRVTQLAPWLVATISPSTVYMPMSPAWAGLGMAVTQSAHAVLLLAPTPGAPAFVQAPLELLAFAHANGAYMPSETRNQISAQAGFYALTDLRAPVQHLGLRAGEEAVLPLTVANLGNGPVRVRFALDGAPEGVEVTLPASLVLGTRMEGDRAEDTRATVALRVAAEGSYQAGDVVLRAFATHARDPAVNGDTVALEVHVSEGGEREGVQVHTLGSAGAGAPAWMETGLAMAALAGVGLAAMARRRA